jgi:hypothetical protein
VMGLYRTLLRQVAPKLDREHGAAVEEMFDTRRREMRTAGGRRFAWFWIRELAGVLKAGVSERAIERRLGQRQTFHDHRGGCPCLKQ